MNEGFIALHRKLLEWEWFTDHKTFHVFMYCLLKANWKDKTYRGKLIRRGCFLTSRESLAKDTGLSVKNVRTALSNLERTNELAIKSSRQGTEIQVINYDKYQQWANDPAKEGPAERPTNGQQGASTNKDNKYNSLVALPENFIITDSMQEWFDKQAFDFDLVAATGEWKDYCLANGRKFKDWSAAWRNGMKKHQEFARKRPSNVVAMTPIAQTEIAKRCIEKAKKTFEPAKFEKNGKIYAAFYDGRIEESSI